MEQKNYLVSILKEMGTDVDHLKMTQWEIFDEIIRRIHLAIDEKKRFRLELKRLRNQNEALRKMHLNFRDDVYRKEVKKYVGNFLGNGKER